MPTTTVDGRTAAWSEAGSGGPPLLLVHGFTGGRDDFDHVLPALAHDRRVVAVDLPGHGGSEGSGDEAAHGLAPVAGWVLRFADAVGLDELALAGHSYGGLVAQRVASAASQRLTALVLADTGVGALRESAAADVVGVALLARDAGLDAAFDAILQRHAERNGEELEPDEAARQRTRFRRLSVPGLVGEARALVSAMPLGAFLRGIDVPVLVLHGTDDDRWTPSEQRLLARTVRGAQLVVLPRSAHSPQVENPTAWSEAVGAFLRQVATHPANGTRTGR